MPSASTTYEEVYLLNSIPYNIFLWWMQWMDCSSLTSHCLLAAVLDEKYLEHTVLVIGAHTVYVLLVYMYGLHCCW